MKQNCDDFGWLLKSRDYGMTHSTGKSLMYYIIDFLSSQNYQLPVFPRMPCYSYFSCLADSNIQTNFQLEKHIVFHQMIDLPIYRFHKMKPNELTTVALRKQSRAGSALHHNPNHIVFQNIYQDIVAKI